MLHITHPTSNAHKKACIAEVFIGLVMLAIFFVPVSEASDITATMVLKLVNNARQAANVVILKENDLLQKAAQQKAQDMIANDYFAHVSPQGKSPWDWINENNYDYKYAGENLAINFTNAEDQQKAWMDSPSHKKNIINPNYQETGIAALSGIIDGHEAIVVVEMFGSQMAQATAAGNIFNPGNEAAVAGLESGGKQDVSALQKFSDKMNLQLLFQNNSLTLIGWLAAFGLAIILILIDIAALIHKKHDPMFILHRKKTHSQY